MFRSVLSFVCSVGCTAVMYFMLAVSSLFAQGGSGKDIELTDPGINWSGMAGSLVEMLIAPIIVGIGIALTIWAVMAAVKFFKRSTK